MVEVVDFEVVVLVVVVDVVDVVVVVVVVARAWERLSGQMKATASPPPSFTFMFISIQTRHQTGLSLLVFYCFPCFLFFF